MSEICLPKYFKSEDKKMEARKMFDISLVRLFNFPT